MSLRATLARIRDSSPEQREALACYIGSASLYAYGRTASDLLVHFHTLLNYSMDPKTHTDRRVIQRVGYSVYFPRRCANTE